MSNQGNSSTLLIWWCHLAYPCCVLMVGWEEVVPVAVVEMKEAVEGREEVWAVVAMVVAMAVMVVVAAQLGREGRVSKGRHNGMKWG